MTPANHPDPRRTTSTTPELSAGDAMELALEGSTALGQGTTRWAIAAIAGAFALFQVWSSLLNPLPAITLRAVHAAFLITLCFLIFTPRAQPRAGRAGWHDWGCAALGGACGLYFLYEGIDFASRPGLPNEVDLIVGTAFVVLIFEATRRAAGLALPILCGIVLAWAFLGDMLPAPFNHRGYGYDQIIGQLVVGTEGLLGTATGVSATYIFLFILFSAFMQQSGVLALFNDLAIRWVGGWRSGPAQACIVSSALTGMVSGSGIANVVSSGQITIPLMKRYGYRPDYAAAVEASSSMGGQLMPPIMGAGAFIMAEILDIPYVQIAIAATIPAILYFAGIGWITYLEARRLGLGAERVRLPQSVMRGRWHLLMPLLVIIGLLFLGYSPIYSAMAALAFTLVLILGRTFAMAWLTAAALPTYLAVMAAAGGILYAWGSLWLAVFVILLALVNAAHPAGRQALRACARSAYQGTIGAVVVGISCVIIGVMDGIFGMTGIMVEVTSALITIGQGQLWISLVLVMLSCFVLGLGLPTIPSYVICATVAAPALLGLGVAPFLTHMFIFYFSILAQLTPPIALAAIAAAPFAGPGVSPMRIGWIGTLLGLSGFLVPFVGVYSPELLLVSGTWLDTVLATVRVMLAVGFAGAAFVGFLRGPLGVPARLVLTCASVLMVFTDPLFYGVGAMVGIALLMLNGLRPGDGRQVAAP
ncbi:TRAP transporter permease [Rhodovarius lipocyclicus]|uniref:TRAP transporter permease n=1 Tax=Rhodovarius lipocyclicus TaxID=268410 RepID=UPI0013585D5A|nr:TRAP transporter fused permease subunit [Rhodovarius lipocyclicus]